MIPDKLYLPTSTLNFNNIMSSESISPASFYSRRGFGYKRFEKVNPNNLDNRIILYDRYPVFDIDDKELENYPMVIEFESKTLREDVIKEQKGLYYSEETIYLNPFSTRIIFRNNTEKAKTISKAEPSIETKMVSFYKNCFIQIGSQIDFDIFNWENTNITDSKNDISKFISEDRKINKIKGLLYAYLIASNKSISADIVSLKKHVRNLKNTLSAIIISPDSRATASQEEQLESLYKVINNKLQNIFLAPIIKEKSEKYQCDFYNILTKENLWDIWLRQNNYSKYQVPLFYANSKDKDKAFNHYIQNLEHQILIIEQSQKKSKVGISSMPVLQYKRVINIPEQKEFLTKLFNEYLDEAYNSEEFIQSRYEFAKSGGKIFKDEIQDKWQGSPWQQYINALLKNLNEFSAFDLKSANNVTLESFAAFCQKGESDIDKLEDYLISNEIGDFRVAFSLWGIVFGFVNMPKTLSNDLFLLEDLDYITHIYKHIFKQLHGVELDGKIEKAPITKQTSSETSVAINPKVALVSEETSKNLLEKQGIKQKLKDCNFKPEQTEDIFQIYEKNSFIINDKFFTTLKKIRGIGDKAIEKIKSALGNEEIHSKKSTQKGEPSLFGDIKPELGTDFYCDPNAWLYIIELLPVEKKIQKQLKDDLDWFQGNFKENYLDNKKGVMKGFYSEKPKDNKSTIDQFKKFLENKLTGDQPWLRNIYAQVNIEEINLKLKSLYLYNEG